MAFWGNFGLNLNFNSWFMPQFGISHFTFPSFSEIWNSFYMPVRSIQIPSIWQPQIYSNITKKAERAVEKSRSVISDVTSYPKIKLNSLSSTIFDNYDADAGKRLAKTALNKAVGWTGYCARYVKTAIEKAGLGAYEYGHAFQMPSILRRNKNFKEISVESVDVRDLPAGCVLVYGKGKSGYSSSWGHTEITTGDGRAVSDGITKNLHKTPSAIFMPVEHNYLA